MKIITEVRTSEPVPFAGAMRVLFRPNVPQGLTISREGGAGNPVTLSYNGENLDLYPSVVAFVRWKEGDAA